MPEQAQAAASPWEDATPPAQRAPWGTLTRGDVIDAAAGIVTAGGYEDMTIHSLAAELGVAPMSLYRHIRDKDDLLDEVVGLFRRSGTRDAGSAEALLMTMAGRRGVAGVARSWAAQARAPHGRLMTARTFLHRD